MKNKDKHKNLSTPTPFSEIFDFFLVKVKDYDLARMQNEDMEALLTQYLRVACVRFKVCRKNLQNRDMKLKQFNEQLSDSEMEILAEHIMVQWLESYLNDTDILRNKLNTKDFNFFSPANLLEQIRDRYETAEFHARKLTNAYSYEDVDLKGWLRR